MKVLFLCTANSARSILAEAYLNAAGKGRFAAYSAGSRPGGAVNPFAIELLEGKGIRIAGLRSKSWDEFAAPGAPRMDLVLTVCDNAAGEACPFWPGQPVTAHWGIADPAAMPDKPRAFLKAYGELSARIDLLLDLPIERLSRAELIARLREIGSQNP